MEFVRSFSYFGRSSIHPRLEHPGLGLERHKGALAGGWVLAGPQFLHTECFSSMWEHPEHLVCRRGGLTSSDAVSKEVHAEVPGSWQLGASQ